MLLIIGIAATAATAVLVYNHYRDQEPELAVMSTKRAQQLAAVVLVFSRAVEGVIEAPAYSGRTQPAFAGNRTSGRTLMEDWDEKEYR